jgi:23S rRNA (uridine2552-2'-O)-methyltransferase
MLAALPGTGGGPGAFGYGAQGVLKGGGDALIKVLQGTAFQELIQQDARGRFAKVKLVKPAASRSRSPEMYLLAKDFRLV